MIVNNVVYGEPASKIPGHLSCGSYFMDKIRGIKDQEDKIALINGDTGKTTTYKELLQETVNVAVGLQQLGIKPGDVVAIFSENIPQYMTAFMGSVCSGATVTNIGVIYSSDEVRHLLNISEPKMILCSESCLKENYNTIKSMSFIEKIVQLNGDPVEENIIPYQCIMVETNVYEYEPVEVRGATDTALILYSSGTTGLPKGVMLTHLNVLYSIANFDVESIYAVEFNNILTVIPWYHVYGLIITIIYILMKKQIVYLEKFVLDKYLLTIQEYKIDMLITVPPIVVSIAKNPVVTNYDLSSIKMLWCGGASLHANSIQMAMNRMPNCYGIYEAYGLTETCMAAAKNPEKYKYVLKTGSIGVPMPGMKFKVEDVNTKKKLGPNEKGEICIKGPLIMKGYLSNEKESSEAIDKEGYLKTGDIGYYDEDGYFFIVDRLKELIKYKGHQVAPAFIESTILQHPGVADCGVVGATDELAGEVPVAFVVRKKEVTLTERELLDFANEKLSSISRLRGGIIFIDAIPRNGSGKILRRQLQLILKSKLHVV